MRHTVLKHVRNSNIYCNCSINQRIPAWCAKVTTDFVCSLSICICIVREITYLHFFKLTESNVLSIAELAVWY